VSEPVFDLIVVGGGPSGSAAACTAARHGLRVVVVDRKRFPRDKLCGGLLTLRAAKVYERIFTEPWDAVIESRAGGLRLMSERGQLNEVRDYKALQFTSRRAFDAHLLRQAEAAGAEMLLGQAVSAVECDPPCVVLQDGHRLAARTVIGADGVASTVGRCLFGRSFNPRTIAFGLEMEVPREATRDPDFQPEIYFGMARWGYGWVFPKADTLTVGVGGLLARNPDLRDTFTRLLSLRFGGVPTQRIKGCHIPYGDFRVIPGRGNVILCGDAAGLVEPITGEGIAFAMHSGQLAALAVVQALKQGGTALEAFLPNYRPITTDLRLARALRQLVFPRLVEPVFLFTLPKLRNAPRRHMDLMADDLGYPAYARYIATSVLMRGWLKLLPT
jgi:geranylgeranyl reductase family protein